MAPRHALVSSLCLALCLLVVLAPENRALPILAEQQLSEQILETMRNIPQWHCLRYRRFDLVRRCRHMRGPRHHE